MRILDLVNVMESIAPPSLAEEWDNVGLLLGDREAEAQGPSILTIEMTRAVFEEAKQMAAGAIITYHPPIFRPLSRLTADDEKGAALLGAAAAGMAVYSPHTALDAVEGGVTDWLCDMLAPEGADGSNFGDRRALAPAAREDPRATHKIVTFVPPEDVDQVRDALSSVGLGRIGAYERCSYVLKGRGTFFGGEGTNPTVGEAGRLEEAEEVRVEMVCPASALALAHEMLRRFHPYEEPAWDVYPLTPKPDRSVGAGRRLTLDQPATPRELGERLKHNLGVDAVKVAATSEAPIKRIGVCPGSGGSLMEAALADGCQAFVTGELKHHEAARAAARGMSIILAGHTNTERGYLPTLARRMSEANREIDARVSREDVTLFRTI